MIALLVMTDGRRDLIRRTVVSALANARPAGVFSEYWIHDDSGDQEYQAWLLATFPADMIGMRWRLIITSGRAGFGGAIQNAWEHLVAKSSARFVFHLEDDFTFNRPFDLHAMADILERRPELAQMALRRQAWNEAEIAAGGVVESNPDAYNERSERSQTWLEHRLFFTTNPSLYRFDLMRRGWPNGRQSEGVFTHKLLDDDYSFGYWGHKTDEPWVTHTGTERAGTGY